MVNYESNKILEEYLLMHYGSSEERMPWGVERIAEIDYPKTTVNYFTQKEVGISLDLGCAVGAASFHLSKTSQKVVGLDLSENFIKVANQLKENGEFPYKYQEEGSIYENAIAKIPTESVPEKVSFAPADVLNLPDGFKNFDRVYAANLLCRLSDPTILIERFSSLVKSGGELVLSTPFSWLETFTPLENQPNGDSWEWLKKLLSENFKLMREADEMFIIREHVRKYQLGIAKVSMWARH